MGSDRWDNVYDADGNLLASPTPNREPTAERCEHGAVPASSCFDLRCLRAQLSREVEARRRAEERDEQWQRMNASIGAARARGDEIAAERDEARRDATEARKAVHRAMADLDEARAAVTTAEREKEGLRVICDMAQRRANEAEAERDRAEAVLATAQGDLDSLTRELATICGGPGQPREGETRVAYWLRRVGEAIATAERERDRAITGVSELKADIKRRRREWQEQFVRANDAEVALATATERVREFEQTGRDLLRAWDEEPPTREAVMPEIRQLRRVLAAPPPSPSATREGEDGDADATAKRGRQNVMVMVANRTGVEVGYLAGRYHGLVGHLYSPGTERGPWPFLPYALDNGAFVAWEKKQPWDEAAWRRLLLWAAMAGQRPLWCIVPDVVANRDATLRAWEKYAPEVTRYGFRPAFAAQDGMTFDDVPSGDCVVFLGGSTEWKEAAIAPWCARFPGRVHVGRVNTWRRLLACYRAGAISVDGTGWFTKKGGQAADLARFLEYAAEQRSAA